MTWPLDLYAAGILAINARDAIKNSTRDRLKSKSRVGTNHRLGGRS